MTVGVNISSFKIKKKNSHNDELVSFYSNLSDNKQYCNFLDVDIIQVIEEFFKSKIKAEQDDYQKKYFSTKDNSLIINENNERIYISFTVKYGSYGYKSDITNINTNKILFKRNLNNADVKNFRVMFAFSKKQEQYEIYKGIVLFQTIGQYGIKTITTTKFNDFLSKEFNLKPIFKVATTRKTFEKIIMKGKLKKMDLIKNEVNPEFSSMFGVNCGKEIKTIILSSVREKKSFADKILDLATSGNEIYELDDTYNDIKITVDMNGRSKTSSIKNIDSLYIIEELPNDVLDIDGDINVSRMDEELIKCANDYLNQLIQGEEKFD